jgi:hypothetical protein
MTTENQEDRDKRNEAIALYMDMPITRMSYTFSEPPVEVEEKVNWRYDKSWDLLMPVFEKIEKEVKEITIQMANNVCIIKKYGFLEYELLIDHTGETKIKAVFFAVSDYCLTIKEKQL